MLYLLACGQAQLREFGENFSSTPAGLPLCKESDFSSHGGRFATNIFLKLAPGSLPAG